ncbi:MAG: PadR family transcriptional regulator [Euryarchaeota archaeon]|nr:PadR family transcriptional regulator [Euryarchaeota archaeon]
MSRFDILNSKVAQDMQRGLLKLYILRLVLDQRLHGYAIMDKLKEMTKSHWRPSPGSIYPALRSLEKAGLVKSVFEKNRRLYTITPLGRKFVHAVSLSVEEITDDIRALFKVAPDKA